MLDARRLPFECFYPWSTFVNPPLTVTAPIYLEGIHSPFSFGFSAAVCPLCTSSSTPNLIRSSSLSFHFLLLLLLLLIFVKIFVNCTYFNRLRFDTFYPKLNSKWKEKRNQFSRCLDLIQFHLYRYRPEADRATIQVFLIL